MDPTTWWLFEPFHNLTVGTFLRWMIATSVIAILVGTFRRKVLGIESESILEKTTPLEGLFKVTVLAPLLEEIVLRGGLSFLIAWIAFGDQGIIMDATISPFGLPFPIATISVLIVVSVFWALLHNRSAMSAMVSVPLFVKLWAGGYIGTAIFAHALHNTWVWAGYYGLQR